MVTHFISEFCYINFYSKIDSDGNEFISNYNLKSIIG